MMPFQPDFRQRTALTNTLLGARGQRQDLFLRRNQLQLGAAQNEKDQRNTRTAQLARFFEIKEQRKAEKKAKKKSSFAGLGAAGGAAVGIAGALTGGIALSALPALTAAGGAIGGVADTFSGQGSPQATQAITQGATTIGNAFAPQTTFVGGQGFVTQQPTFSNVFLGAPLEPPRVPPSRPTDIFAMPTSPIEL